MVIDMIMSKRKRHFGIIVEIKEGCAHYKLQFEWK